MAPSTAPTSWASYAQELGLELQRHRMASGLTQEDLAHRAGLTRTHYQQLERGFWKQGKPSNPSTKILARLSQVLGLEIADLLPTVASLAWNDAEE